MKSGFVSIVGRPNVGKSTLINKLINHKVAITSDKAGTTRNNIFGIYNDKDTQIIFIDTPGIGRTITKLDEVLNKKAYQSLENDIVLFIVDISSGFGKNDQKILDSLKDSSKKVILVLNKIDKISKEKLLLSIDSVRNLYDFKAIVPISSLSGDNCTELINVIKEELEDDVKYFNDDEITNVSEKFMISELIREKVLNLTHDEVPYTIATTIENISFTKKNCIIDALIIVDRENLKAIIIGKNGSMLKKIGTESRKDIEAFLHKKVYLNIFVKVITSWRDKPSSITDLGLDE